MSSTKDLRLLRISSLSKAVNFCNLSSSIALACSSSKETLDDEVLLEEFMSLIY